MSSLDSFRTKSTQRIGAEEYTFYHIEKLRTEHRIDHLPLSLKILLENLLRHEDNRSVFATDIHALLHWDPQAEPCHEIAFQPARVLLQDFTGVPVVADLAALRDALYDFKADPDRIHPFIPVELVIDHSVMVDQFGHATAHSENTRLEYQRNQERYAFLRWGQNSFRHFHVVPPNTGIVHQVNVEYLASVVFKNDQTLYFDTVIGTDSHTTMINGLGVLGWGVGGIEAEAASLGQPVPLLLPRVIGCELVGQMPAGTTATDLVLRITEILRQKGVVNTFVEFYGSALDTLPLSYRSTIANMAPEYGATCGLFPIDQKTLEFLRLTGRSAEEVDRIEQYARLQGVFREPGAVSTVVYSDSVRLDLSSIEPSLAGPKRPQDRVALKNAHLSIQSTLHEAGLEEPASTQELAHGSVVIAAITSCTNTSNPEVMIAAGLLAKKAQALGLKTKPWVKTSLAPGSLVVTDYLEKAGLIAPLASLGFNIVGYGCTTCIGNSGPLPTAVSEQIAEKNLQVCAVLSGNRNFEGRIHSEVMYAYLASPPLVVLYALLGTLCHNIYRDPIGRDQNNQEVFFEQLWPSAEEINAVMHQALQPELFKKRYSDVFKGDALWQGIPLTPGLRFPWAADSTYIRQPPYFKGISSVPEPLGNMHQARILALLGDSVTTDHISPAGSIAPNSPAGLYLREQGVSPADFNSYGSRRGNHEVMIRGTFANKRLKNTLAKDLPGGSTVHLPSQTVCSIYEAAMRYAADKTALIIVAGKEYGTGSSRDWAAKGTALLGVKMVIAQSFERIHRSNLIGMGVLPCEFMPGESAQSLGLTGTEAFDVDFSELKPRGQIHIHSPDLPLAINLRVRIDTPQEFEYFKHGGILPYTLRQLASL